MLNKALLKIIEGSVKMGDTEFAFKNTARITNSVYILEKFIEVFICEYIIETKKSIFF